MAENYSDLIKKLSQQMNMSQNQLNNAVKNGDVKSMLKNTDSKTAKKAEEILNDPQKTKELLESPQAQAILKILREKGNGRP